MTSSRRLIITITVVLLAGMELMDTTIVNVSLPNMMGSLSANIEQISWVLTSYIIASSIMMPLTGFLVNNLGQKRLMIMVSVGFLAASMLCGISTSVSQIVVFRVMQGMCGASLVPLSQLILKQVYSRDEQAKAMAIWGAGIMIAPVIGPTIGGYITEYANWRWVFYINLPICIICLLLILAFIPESPKQRRTIDWTGLILMAIGVGCLQIFLDQGNQKDWLSSNLIFFLMIASALAILIFIVRGLSNSNNIVNFKLFKDRNYALCCLMFLIFMGAMLGAFAIMPIMLQKLMGYPTILNGLVVAPGGIASGISMAIAPFLMRRIGNKSVMILGVLLSLYSIYLMSKFNLYIDVKTVVYPAIIRGAGMGLFIVPLAVEAFITLPDKFVPEASGFFAFCRMIGNAIGISVLNTILSRQIQTNWNRLGGHLTIFKFPHLDSLSVHQLGFQLNQQASMIAFINCYWADTFAFVILIPMVFLLVRVPKQTAKLRI